MAEGKKELKLRCEKLESSLEVREQSASIQNLTYHDFEIEIQRCLTSLERHPHPSADVFLGEIHYLRKKVNSLIRKQHFQKNKCSWEKARDTQRIQILREVKSSSLDFDARPIKTLG
ncbi:hypothetical protein HAX54_013927 [Datura stramonium]|uniref:Uncharacterized protein n=1 Tax=Datura stramonium TaxID=4076 RepID=A0ABS8TM59_DATST|nr:hypothetical protein [Datura stramonium]